jgi:hypothetical protein
VARVRSWGNCSRSYLNAYAQNLGLLLPQLAEQQAQVKAATLAAVAAAAAAAAKSAQQQQQRQERGGGSSSSSRPGIDPVVSALVQRIFDKLTGRNSSSSSGSGHESVAADQQQQQQQVVLPASVASRLEGQAGRLLEQVDDGVVVLQAEVVSMAPYRCVGPFG